MADEIPLIVERDGKVLTLSLNNVNKKNAPIPILLACSCVHHSMIKRKKREVLLFYMLYYFNLLCVMIIMIIQTHTH